MIKPYLTTISQRFKSILLPKTIILLYHRVADVAFDPYLLAVDPRNFAVHLKYLKSNYQVISLKTLVAGWRKKNIPTRAVVITFDDGYADNYSQAVRFLRPLTLPATFFVTAQSVNSQRPFYWDKATPRKDQGRCLSQKKLKLLSKDNLFEIGSHSLTHPHLSQLSLKRQRKEILGSKKRLEKITAKPVNFFSYPFGTANDYNDQTLTLLKQGGYKAACANFPGMVTKQTSLFQLPRFIIRNWKISQFKKELSSFFAYEHSSS